MTSERFTDAERSQLLKLAVIDLLQGRGQTQIVKASRIANRMERPPVAKGTAWAVSDANGVRSQQEIARIRAEQQAEGDAAMATTDGVPIFTKHSGATLPVLRRRGQ